MGMSSMSLGTVTFDGDFLGFPDVIQASMQVIFYHPDRTSEEPEAEILLRIEDKEEYEKIFYHLQDTFIEHETSEDDEEIRFKRFPMVISYVGKHSIRSEGNDNNNEDEVLM